MVAGLDLRLVSLNTENLDEMIGFYNKFLEREPDLIEEDRLIEYRFEGVLLGLYDPSADNLRSEIQVGDSVVPAFRTDDLAAELKRISRFAEYSIRRKSVSTTGLSSEIQMGTELKYIRPDF